MNRYKMDLTTEEPTTVFHGSFGCVPVLDKSGSEPASFSDYTAVVTSSCQTYSITAAMTL